MNDQPDFVTRIHPLTRIGGPPEHREWFADASKPYIKPEIHPTARIQSFVTVDSGCYRATSVGANTVLMAHVHVGHDALIGEDCELAPGAKLGGHAEIGNGCKIGINATVLPYRKVGDGAVVGAGAVITADVAAGAVVAGNPARELPGKNPVPYTERV